MIYEIDAWHPIDFTFYIVYFDEIVKVGIFIWSLCIIRC